jgi:hypothetical protein
LKPSNPQAEPENYFRFQVIHMALLPVVSGASVAVWFTLFRKGRGAALKGKALEQLNDAVKK